MSTTETDDNSMSKCAACGKNDGDGLKVCTSCKLVKYCNASCQRAHWSKHKKECKKRAAELHDGALFKKPPPREECDICCLPLPLYAPDRKYQACCGKDLCMGCIHAAFTADRRRLCPFCRTPEATSDGEIVERIKKRVEAADAYAISNLGYLYYNGRMGFPRDHGKAMELWLRAGELGCSMSCHRVAMSYRDGEGAERDMKKHKYYLELAAIGGDVTARHNLGMFEAHEGTMRRAVKHYMISAEAGYDNSLEAIRKCFMNGDATKDDFEKALRAHKEAEDAMRSDQREAALSARAAAARGQN